MYVVVINKMGWEPAGRTGWKILRRVIYCIEIRQRCQLPRQQKGTVREFQSVTDLEKSDWRNRLWIVYFPVHSTDSDSYQFLKPRICKWSGVRSDSRRPCVPLSLGASHQTMSSARALYAEPKAKLCERVCLNLNTFAGIAAGIGRGGRAEEVSSTFYLLF